MLSTGDVFEVTNRQWNAREVDDDEFLAPQRRVPDSMLSEHQCEEASQHALKRLGDGLMALFGYPHALENDAERAVRAAALAARTLVRVTKMGQISGQARAHPASVG